MVKERIEIPSSDRWNVEALYESIASWEAELQKWLPHKKGSSWPELSSYRGTLHQGPDQIISLLEKYFTYDRALSKLYTYAHLRHDEDVSNEIYKQAYIRITHLLHQFQEEMSWFEPELLQLSDEELKKLLKFPEAALYKIYLEKIIRFKPHTLSGAMEELLAKAGMALETAQKTFSAFNNADLKFLKIRDSKGKEYELTHGKYSSYLRDQDRELRKAAYLEMHRSFQAYENTLCELISGQVQQHLFIARARRFDSCLQAALFPHQIDVSVYHNLIKTVRAHLPVLHSYMALRKKMLGVEELHLYDLHVPLVKNVDFSMEYEAAEKAVIASLSPLGADYQKDLAQGLTVDRWVDRYENARKRSGAYSSGCYDSMPYILMNYHGHFHDAMTLSHEAGHSMHSLLSRRSQAYQNSHYPIFVAEVASTFHEELLLQHFLNLTTEKERKAFLINQEIEDIRNTFFRQTMFAEFELKIHEFAEKGVPLTPALLKKEYRQLNSDYFGPSVVCDAEADIEWARIPHFYYNFYVYQYATGISAAHALVEVVKKNGAANYLKFLSSGGSKYPLDLLLLAGVDMHKPDAILSLIHHFEALTTKLRNVV